MNETDDCDTTPRSTFVPIVQECRLFPPLLLLPSLSLSSHRFLRVSLFRTAVRIAKTRYSLDRYAPRLSLFLAPRTPTLQRCGRERTGICKSLESWPQYLTVHIFRISIFSFFSSPLFAIYPSKFLLKRNRMLISGIGYQIVAYFFIIYFILINILYIIYFKYFIF